MHGMADGGRCRRATSAGGSDLGLGDEQSWQEVLTKAAGVKRLRTLDDGAWLAAVTGGDGSVELYRVEPSG